MTRALRAALIIAAITLPATAQAADKWITSWVASAQGPYPVGNPSAQPVLKFAFPTPEAGARDQSFRLVLMPEIWGNKARLRFTNVFGTRPVTFDGVHAGLQLGSATLMPGILTPDEMARLSSAKGPEFDRLFLEGMIKHHGGALTMVEQLLGTPADIDPAAAGGLHGLSVAIPASPGELDEALAGDARMIVVRTDRRRNLALHRELAEVATAAVTPT